MAVVLTFETLKNRKNNFPVSTEKVDRKSLVLVVEDHDDSRFMLKQLLESWNYNVAEAKDGVEAVCKFVSERPDLILMDVELPRLNGFAATEHIRQHNAHNKVPIIFLSACAELAAQKQAEVAGGDDYLVKQLNLAQLKSTLEKRLKQVTSQNILSLKRFG